MMLSRIAGTPLVNHPTGALPASGSAEAGDLTANRPRHLGLAPRDRALRGAFVVWREAIGSVFDVAANPAEISAFDGDLEIYSTHRVLLSGIACAPIRLVRSPATISRDRRDHFALWLVCSGGLAGISARSAFHAGPGDVVFLDLQQTVDFMTSLSGDTTESLVLWAPRARWLSSISDDDILHGLVLSGASPAGAMIGASLRAFAANAFPMSVAEMNSLTDGLIEMAAKAVAPSLAAAGASDGPSALASFVAIRRYIDRNLTSTQLDADGLAKQFGVSRSTLYRLFEPVGGIAGYIRRQRLHRAYQEVVAAETSNARLGQIGYRLGFGTLGAFSRTFRASFGVSPREARKAALAGARPVALKADPERAAASLGGWLADLGKA